jgi:hypothetical protein
LRRAEEGLRGIHANVKHTGAFQTATPVTVGPRWAQEIWSGDKGGAPTGVVRCGAADVEALR